MTVYWPRTSDTPSSTSSEDSEEEVDLSASPPSLYITGKIIKCSFGSLFLPFSRSSAWRAESLSAHSWWSLSVFSFFFFCLSVTLHSLVTLIGIRNSSLVVVSLLFCVGQWALTLRRSFSCFWRRTRMKRVIFTFLVNIVRPWTSLELHSVSRKLLSMLFIWTALLSICSRAEMSEAEKEVSEEASEIHCRMVKELYDSMSAPLHTSAMFSEIYALTCASVSILKNSSLNI